MARQEVAKLACELQPGDYVWGAHHDSIYTVLSVCVTNAKVKVKAIQAPREHHRPTHWQFEPDREVRVMVDDGEEDYCDCEGVLQ